MFTPFAFVKSGIVYDPDAQAFINATGISGTEATAINTLVLDLKSYSLWTKMKAVYPMVGGTSTTCKYNLINPVDTNAGYRLSFVGGWTFSSTGADPNGTNGYANTFLPQTDLTNNSGHLSYYSRQNDNGILIGADDSTRYSMSPDYATGDYYCSLQTTTAKIGAAFDMIGFWVGTRTTDSAQDFYEDGVNKGIDDATSSARQNFNFFIASRNNSGTATNFSGAECAFASIGDGLDSTEVSNLNTAVQAFNTTLSRNV